MAIRSRRALAAPSTVAFLLAATAACASTASTPPPPPAHATITATFKVSGLVLAAPGCPGAQPVEGTACPPKPMPGASVKAETGDGRIIAEATAATGGFWQFRLPAGRYRITATAPAPLKSTASRDVTISAGAVSDVDLTVDSGMR